MVAKIKVWWMNLRQEWNEAGQNGVAWYPGKGWEGR